MEVEHLIQANPTVKRNNFMSIFLVSLIFITTSAGAFYFGKNQNQSQTERATTATPLSTKAPVTPTPFISPTPTVKPSVLPSHPATTPKVTPIATPSIP